MVTKQIITAVLFLLATFIGYSQSMEVLVDNMERTEDLEADTLGNLFVCGALSPYVAKYDTSGNLLWNTTHLDIFPTSPGSEARYFSFLHVIPDQQGGVFAFGRKEYTDDQLGIIYLDANGNRNWVIQGITGYSGAINNTHDLFWKSEDYLFLLNYDDNYGSLPDSTIIYKIDKTSGNVVAQKGLHHMRIRYSDNIPFFEDESYFLTLDGIVALNEEMEIRRVGYYDFNPNRPEVYNLDLVNVDNTEIRTLFTYQVFRGSNNYEIWQTEVNVFDSSLNLILNDTLTPGLIAGLDSASATSSNGYKHNFAQVNQESFVVCGAASKRIDNETKWYRWYGQYDGMSIQNEYSEDIGQPFIPSKIAVVDEVAIIYEDAISSGRLRKYPLVDSPNGLQKQIALTSFQLFPNPTSSTLNISFEQTQEATVGIYSLTGALLLERQFNTQNAQLDVSGLPEGMYVVRVSTAQGIESQKVVISR